MPPLLPLPCFAQRNFLTPPLPGMTFPVSGCSSSKLCKPEYSSSVKYFSISLVNIVVSINIIALIIRHCRIITSRKFIGERLDKLRPGLWQLLTITGTFVNGNSFRKEKERKREKRVSFLAKLSYFTTVVLLAKAGRAKKP